MRIGQIAEPISVSTEQRDPFGYANMFTAFPIDNQGGVQQIKGKYMSFIRISICQFIPWFDSNIISAKCWQKSTIYFINRNRNIALIIAHIIVKLVT